ncbi:MAG: HAD family phosphatase [Eubacterium sp.]|nr:HAD family phosphatase [Eubacterium sp.]
MKKKLLVLDIDGTLTNSKKEITPKTKGKIKEILELGHMVMIASGRPTPGVQRYVDELELKKYGGYTITFNGARVVDCATGEDIYLHRLPQKYVEGIYNYAMEHEMGIGTYSKDMDKGTFPQIYAANKITKYLRLESDLTGLSIAAVKDFVNVIDYDPYKILMTDNPQVSEKHMLELQEIYGDELNILRSEPFFVEVMAKGIDKATTLAKIIGPLGIEYENTICCGDGFNDISMVRYAAVGVAMENAQEAVKEAANYITASNDNDGIAEVIDKFILND